MFPLPILTWLKLGGVVAVCALMWYMGFSFEQSRFAAYKATIVAQKATIEKEQQLAVDQIRKTKDDQINAINNQLVDAISELRSRPSRAQQASNGQGCTGRSLSAEDAEFLVREAARADEIRAGLESCYRQYDALK
jgi:hypothetical protein